MSELKEICLENHHLEIATLKSSLAEKGGEIAAMRFFLEDTLRLWDEVPALNPSERRNSRLRYLLSITSGKEWIEAVERAITMLEDIKSENHNAIGSDEFFEGLAYACKIIKPKITEVVAELRKLLGKQLNSNTVK